MFSANLVFSVDLVFKEELLKVLRLLVKVQWVELGGTDSLSQLLRQTLLIGKDPNYTSKLGTLYSNGSSISMPDTPTVQYSDDSCIWGSSFKLDILTLKVLILDKNKCSRLIFCSIFRNWNSCCTV